MEEMKTFIRNHFEQFVNRKNLDIADVNFANDFVDHGTDVPPGTPPGPAGAKQYVGNPLARLLKNSNQHAMFWTGKAFNRLR